MFQVFSQQSQSHLQWHLRDNLQLFLLRKWIKMHANSFLVKHIKYHETKIDEEGASKTQLHENPSLTSRKAQQNRT